MSPNDCPALLLNADGRPMSVYPLKLLPWQDAVRDTWQSHVPGNRADGRFDVVAEYDVEVRSPGRATGQSFSMRLPSVLMHRRYQRLDRPAPCTRANVYLRDEGRCGYCSRPISRRELTFDHVVPQCRGGRSDWLNLAASCSPCNARKGDKSLAQSGMRLRRAPWVPSQVQLNEVALRFLRPNPDAIRHGSWYAWLGMEEPSGPALVSGEGRPGGAFPPGMTSEQYWHVGLEE